MVVIRVAQIAWKFAGRTEASKQRLFVGTIAALQRALDDTGTADIEELEKLAASLAKFWPAGAAAIEAHLLSLKAKLNARLLADSLSEPQKLGSSIKLR